MKRCKQALCSVKDDGKCLEGLDIEDCPHFYWEEDENTENLVETHLGSIEQELQAPKVQLYSGSELVIGNIETVTNRFRTTLVVILGEFDCGKTTLLASLYDLFQTGFFANISFAGSLTQIGFEERSHLSRMASGSEKADTERTKYLEFRLLHLAVKKLNTPEIKHLLLSDISGETIRQARNSGQVMADKLSLVTKADCIFYMIDGAKLMSQDRAAVLLNATLFIQNALDNGIFSSGTVLNIIIAKWDILSTDNETDYLNILEQAINVRFASKLMVIKYFKIAARPDDLSSDVPMGYGLEDVLHYVIDQPAIFPIPPIHAIPNGHRNFQNFKVKK